MFSIAGSSHALRLQSRLRLLFDLFVAGAEGIQVRRGV